MASRCNLGNGAGPQSGQEHSVSAKGHGCSVVLLMPVALMKLTYITPSILIALLFQYQVYGLVSLIHLHLSP